MSSPSIVVTTDPLALTELGPRWDALVDSSSRLGPFPLSSWSRLWWRHLKPDHAELRLATVGRGEELVAVAPLWVGRDGDGSSMATFIGDADVTDYTGPAVSSAAADVAAALAIEVARREGAVLDCRSTPDDFGFGAALEKAAGDAGLVVERMETEPAPVLDLPSDIESYFGALDKKERHELRRKIRRFENEIGPARLDRADASSIEQHLELFFGWHRKAPGDKAGFMTAEREAFFRAVASDFMAQGTLALDVLYGGDIPVAAGFSFVIGGTVYLYNSSLDPDRVRDSPGMVLLAGLIRRSIDDGLTRLDFLKGRERYKFQLGGVARPLSSVRIHPAAT